MKVCVVRAYIAEVGQTALARKMSASTGMKFTAQQINHWKNRGIPYRWQDAFCELSGIPKSQLVRKR